MEKRELYSAIWSRKSVRKYSNKQIEEDKVKVLRESISDLNKISGLSMEFAEEYGSFKSILTMSFKNVRSAIVLKGKTDDPDLEEKCGYYGEQIVLKATAMGLGTCWVAWFNKRSTSLNIKSDETVVCVVTIGYGEEAISTSDVVPDAPHRKTKSVSDFLGGNTDVPDWVTAAIKAVQFAPTAMNSQRVRFSYEDGVVCSRTKSGYLSMIDYGIIKCHFELAAGGKFSFGTPSEFVKD
jgi:nitroreductase